MERVARCCGKLGYAEYAGIRQFTLQSQMKDYSEEVSDDIG